jgi:hypothetical protein
MFSQMARQGGDGKIATPGQAQHKPSLDHRWGLHMAALSISQAWDESKARIASDGRLMMVVAIALIALPMAVMGVVSPRTAGAESTLVSSLFFLASSLLAIVGQLAVIRLAIGSDVSVGEAIGHAARRMPIYFLAALVIACALFLLMIPFVVILLAAGIPLDSEAARSPLAIIMLLAFIVLAIFVGVRMLMSSPVASEEAVGPIAIIRRSWQLTSGRFWRLFGFLAMFLIGAAVTVVAVNAAFTLLAVLIFGPVEPMSASALIVAIAEAVVNAAVTVLLAVMLARIYLQLAGRGSPDVSVPNSGS